MEKLPKQDAGKSGSGTTRENFNADEIAQQGSYQDSTEVAEQMREGDKSNGDLVGVPDQAGTSSDTKEDYRKSKK